MSFDNVPHWTGHDEVITEVRSARDLYTAQFEYDLQRIVEDLRFKEAQHPERKAVLLPLAPSTMD